MPSETATANPSTRRSGVSTNRIGTSPGTDSRSRARVAASASARPPAAPSAKSTTISVSSCAASRPRVPPSAARTAISRRRASARAESSAATFTLAMSRTSVAAPSRRPRKPPSVRRASGGSAVSDARRTSSWRRSHSGSCRLGEVRARQRLELAAGRVGVDAGAEARGEVQDGDVGVAERRGRRQEGPPRAERDPRVGLDRHVGALEGGRRHADQREALAVDAHVASHGGAVAAEPRAPEPLRDDEHRRRRLGAVLVGAKKRPSAGRTPSTRKKSPVTKLP
jgi:hypothetical protein